jgi:PilZ domain
MQPETEPAVERRSKSRFPVRLRVRYRTASDESALMGVGQTVNMSSRGLLIASSHVRVQAGERLQLMVDWPFLLHGITPLQLVASCRVTRCLPEEFAVKLEQYLFHTKKR